MAKNKYPFRINGYIYSKGTRAGFMRMQRLGIPRPLFRIEDNLKKITAAYYKNVVRKILQDIKNAARQTNATLDNAPLTQDSLEDLMDFFEQMGKETEEQNQIINQANMGAAANTLEHQWFDNETEVDNDQLKNRIANTLEQEQEDYLGRLFKDAGDKMQQVLVSFSLDKQQVFNDNMDKLRALYLDNSMQRLGWEEDYIKKCILKRIHKYVTGEDTKLRLDDLTKYATAKGENMARLFARDQMQRFNKAMTISTFIEAGVTKVKWVTAHDSRVRKGRVDKFGVYHRGHRELDGMVFDINNLPDEIDDYNCRCGLVPVEWSE